MTVLATAKKDVGRPKTDNTEQIVVRVPKDLRDRLKALIPSLALAIPGVSVTETDVIRAALLRGVEALETQTKSRGRK